MNIGEDNGIFILIYRYIYTRTFCKKPGQYSTVFFPLCYYNHRIRIQLYLNWVFQHLKAFKNGFKNYFRGGQFNALLKNID